MEYIDADLIRMDYDLSQSDSKMVKKSIERKLESEQTTETGNPA